MDPKRRRLVKKSDRNQKELQFFNLASKQELVDYLQCSETQANLIEQLRPYNDFESMQQLFMETKGISNKVVETFQQTNQVLSRVNDVLQQCEQISKDLKEQEIVTLQQPNLINPSFKLKQHQLYGLSWLNLLHDKKLSGILADDMGLGKTIQMISLFCLFEETKKTKGPHLIVCPSSTLSNWMREFQLWAPTILVFKYYGNQEQRLDQQWEIKQKKPTVVVTTYSVATTTKLDRMFLKRMKFETLCLDEGHMIKNKKSNRFMHLANLKTPFRLLLTGTPLQNNLHELASLLQFIMPHLFKDLQDFLKIGENLVESMKKIMSPFVLRRKKTDILLDLPPKEIKIEYCDITPEHREIYQKIEKKESGNPTMDLRKAAIHPGLLREIYNDEKIKVIAMDLLKEQEYWEKDFLFVDQELRNLNDYKIHTLLSKYNRTKKHLVEDSMFFGPQFTKLNTLKRILEESFFNKNKCLLFSQFTMCLDILETFMQKLGYKYLRLDGSTLIEDRILSTDEFQLNNNVFVFLLSTKAGGLGLNLTAANVVIFFDIDFNPHNDLQAEDRAWRLGQMRKVYVFKIISRGTIEESMFKTQQSKLILEHNIIK